MNRLVWVLIIALVVLHQDNFLWDNPTLIGGFMPITLLYHAGISLAASVCWYLATVYCWPEHIEQEVYAEEEGGSQT